MTEALLVRKDAFSRDPALDEGNRGVRRYVVTELRPETERYADHVVWSAPATPERRCPVHVMEDTEVSVFNQHSHQDRHFHRRGTEMYGVLEGTMTLEVESVDHVLGPGDMIVVHPGAVHLVKPRDDEFLCRVVTVNCGGPSDKVVVGEREG